MKRNVLLLVAIALVMISVFLVAEEPPKQTLQQGDVEKFIQTLPALTQDMKNFDTKMDAKQGNITIPEAMKASGDFNAILKKHGWDESFYTKIQTIVMGYSALVYGESLIGANAEIAKALQEIDSNPGFTPEMKAQLKEQMKQAGGSLVAERENMLKAIHPTDLTFIKAKVKELKKVLEESN